MIEMGRTCSQNGKQGSSAFKILTGTQERDFQVGLGVDGMTIYMKEMFINTRYCVDSAQDRNYWIDLGTAGFTSHGDNQLILPIGTC